MTEKPSYVSPWGDRVNKGVVEKLSDLAADADNIGSEELYNLLSARRGCHIFGIA